MNVVFNYWNMKNSNKVIFELSKFLIQSVKIIFGCVVYYNIRFYETPLSEAVVTQSYKLIVIYDFIYPKFLREKKKKQGNK